MVTIVSPELATVSCGSDSPDSRILRRSGPITTSGLIAGLAEMRSFVGLSSDRNLSFTRMLKPVRTKTLSHDAQTNSQDD
jgi:hypothetical protein